MSPGLRDLAAPRNDGLRMILTREAIADRLAAVGYIADRDIATALWLMDFLKRPLLLEGEAGVGKTEVAKALAAVHGAELIRLQCYEGLDQNAALYEWNYQRQLLAIKTREGIGENADAIEEHIFSEEYLLERPLLAAIRRETAAGAADRRGRPRRRGVRGFPARAPLRLPGQHPRARHDQGVVDPARRAHLERHARAVRRAAPPLPLSLCRFSRCRARGAHHPARACRASTRARAADRRAWSAAVRKEDLRKVPGVAETLDWAATLAGLDVHDLRQEPETVHETMICLLKTHEDRVAAYPRGDRAAARKVA